VALTGNPGPYTAADLREQRIFAYRDWQSTGVYLHPGEVFTIRANGSWSYTPGEFHGPDGHPRYPAPNFYPIAQTRGGVLIGRIGEDGPLFLVGSRFRNTVRQEGLLYLRINDDILSDNVGWMRVEVDVVRPTPTPAPVSPGITEPGRE
jgi:hypothetical protein